MEVWVTDLASPRPSCVPPCYPHCLDILLTPHPSTCTNSASSSSALPHSLPPSTGDAAGSHPCCWPPALTSQDLPHARLLSLHHSLGHGGFTLTQKGRQCRNHACPHSAYTAATLGCSHTRCTGTSLTTPAGLDSKEGPRVQERTSSSPVTQAAAI